MPATLKLVQLNIEGSKHLDLVIPFLVAQNPDVVCLQELKRQDIARFEKELSMTCFFTPMHNGASGINGNGIFSNLPMTNHCAEQYGGNWEEGLQEYIHGDRKAGYASSKFMLSMVDIENQRNIFRIGITHFPVTDHGEASDYQRESIINMLKLLAKKGEFVLTGDFNAPRGGEIFAELASHYKDNVPLKYTTSIDGNIHRAGPLPHMVDGIFSTPGCSVSNVEMISGISDHCALVADISLH
ncbi:MAG: endonuclease/exonuclease/phosphatase family protein [Patescibacteria group bacterium]